MCVFEDALDYAMFTECALEALSAVSVDIFAFCLMPNHFHMLVRPSADRDLSHFMQLMTMRHSKRWHRRRESKGGGALYQGRFRAFPVQTDRYFYAACRYVEANPLRARLVQRAEDWPWSSLAQRVKNCHGLPLANWPILQPSDWATTVNVSQKHEEIRQLRKSAHSNIPFGPPAWITRTAVLLGSDAGLRRPGPR